MCHSQLLFCLRTSDILLSAPRKTEALFPHLPHRSDPTIQVPSRFVGSFQSKSMTWGGPLLFRGGREKGVLLICDDAHDLHLKERLIMATLWGAIPAHLEWKRDWQPLHSSSGN